MLDLRELLAPKQSPCGTWKVGNKGVPATHSDRVEAHTDDAGN